MFTFMSGCLTSYKGNVYLFYKRRFLRVVPPLVISCILMYLTGYQRLSFANYFLTCVGLYIFCDPLPQTIWYISMIIMFYFFTPLLLTKSKRYRIINFVSIYGILVFLRFFYEIDDRILIYFPFYFLGVGMDKYKFIEISYQKGLVLFGCGSISFIVLCFLNRYMPEMVSNLVNALIGCILIYGLCISIFPIVKHTKWIKIIAYSSMFMYLFHRPLYEIIINKFLCGFSLLYLLMLVSLVIISYYSQHIYDYFIKKIENF